MTENTAPLGPVPPWLLTAAHTTADAVERVAFWVAVALPLLYVPLFATGVAGPMDDRAVVAVVALNALAVLLGSRYERTTAGPVE